MKKQGSWGLVSRDRSVRAHVLVCAAAKRHLTELGVCPIVLENETPIPHSETGSARSVCGKTSVAMDAFFCQAGSR